MLGKHDLILAGIPALLAKGGVISHFSHITPAEAILGSGFLCLLLMFYALFIDPPLTSRMGT